MFDRNRGGNQLPPASRETTIGGWPVPRLGAIRAWDVKLRLSILVVLIIVIWVIWAGGDPAALGWGFLMCLIAVADRSTVHHLRFVRR
ncbi:hypothetical protein ACFWF9_00110 [Streptomyces roseolus]|uniref:hypothetical protein n=1 Tax=Streptomyces roseolus TaxID=67358 RepID=UPI00365F5AC2